MRKIQVKKKSNQKKSTKFFELNCTRDNLSCNLRVHFFARLHQFLMTKLQVNPKAKKFFPSSKPPCFLFYFLFGSLMTTSVFEAKSFELKVSCSYYVKSGIFYFLFIYFFKSHKFINIERNLDINRRMRYSKKKKKKKKNLKIWLLLDILTK